MTTPRRPGPEANASGRNGSPPRHRGRVLPVGRDGFTLIEVMAAAVIFGLGVLAVVQTTVVLGLTVQEGGEQSEMLLLSRERLDSLRSVSYESLEAGTVCDTIHVQGQPYRITVRVLEAGTDAREIRVTTEPLEPDELPLMFVGYRVKPVEPTTSDETILTW